MNESLTPERILFRLGELRKWQQIQERRLLEQQICQRKTLTEEQMKDSERINNLHRVTNDVSRSSSNTLCEHFMHEDSDTETEYFIPRDSLSIRSVDRNLILNLSNESEPYCTPTPQSDITDNTPEFYSNKSADVLGNIPETMQATTKDAHITRNLTKHRINAEITLEEIPIIAPSKDFKTLLRDNLKNEKLPNVIHDKNKKVTMKYLKRGEGMTRFKLTPDDIGLNMNRKLPWLKKKKNQNVTDEKQNISVIESEVQSGLSKIDEDLSKPTSDISQKITSKKKLNFPKIAHNSGKSDIGVSVLKYDNLHKSHKKGSLTEITDESPNKTLSPVKPPMTWASAFNNDQEKFLTLFKQTSLYRDYFDSSENYMSDSSISLSPSFDRLKINKEAAEQKMFELLEKKVDNASFCSTSSFINKIISGTGNSTPNMNKEYIQTHPRVLNLKPNLAELKTIENLNSSKESVVDHSESFRYLNDFKNDKDLACQLNAGCTSNDDTDEYTESTDTEETCKIVANNLIPTSTPNQLPSGSVEKISKKKDEHEEMSPSRKRKVIKIVIRNDNTDDFTVDHVENISDYDKTLVQKVNKSDVDITDQTFSDLQSDLQIKTDLLKSRLAELESEIEVFRKENEAINILKNDILKEKAEMERKVNEDKVIGEYYLAEEKEKLAKQKLLYDRHIKEMKGQSLKKDREEISFLKNQLNDLRQHIANKDAKTGAFQARLRNQIKNLEKENDDLWLENEKLQKENKKISHANARTRRLSNIKSLAQINKSLAQFTVENKMNEVEIEDVYPVKSISSTYLAGDESGDKSNRIISRRNGKPTVLRHRAKSVPNLSTATSSYAKYFSKKDEKLKLEYSDLNSGQNSNNHSYSDIEENEIILPADDFRRNSSGNVDDSNSFTRQHDDHKTQDISSHGVGKDINLTNPDIGSYRSENLIEKTYMEKFNRISDSDSAPKMPDRINKNDDAILTAGRSENKSEIDWPDGSKEIRFENGNTKIVSADGSYSKFTYYNGDIKETFYKEGMIKYFYKEVNTYHTTYKDGSQVLQFPDGHLERRYKDGSIQAHLPGGATRWTKPDGNEEWRFPDGTLVMVNANGEQTLRFPNGQTEIHTHDHKRREFPDGTVKVVYADGVVETRYANGRIRVKDKHGNLVMDSAVRHNSQSISHT